MEAYHIDRFGSVDGFVLRSSAAQPTSIATRRRKKARRPPIEEAPQLADEAFGLSFHLTANIAGLTINFTAYST